MQRCWQPRPLQLTFLAAALVLGTALLSEDDRQIVEQRMAGCGWPEIAERINSTGEAVRKRFSRALDKAAEHLGMDSVTDE